MKFCFLCSQPKNPWAQPWNFAFCALSLKIREHAHGTLHPSFSIALSHAQSQLNLNPTKTSPSNPDSFLENVWMIDRKRPLLNFWEIWVTWYRDVWPALLRRLSRQNIHSIIHGRPEPFSKHSFTSKTNRHLISQSKRNCSQLSLLIPNLAMKLLNWKKKKISNQR